MLTEPDRASLVPFACLLLVLSGCSESSRPREQDAGSNPATVAANSAGDVAESNAPAAGATSDAPLSDGGKHGVVASDAAGDRDGNDVMNELDTDGPSAAPAVGLEDGPSGADDPDAAGASGTETGGRLAEQLKNVVIPPPWLADATTSYDTNEPWEKARLEIRRLLGIGQIESHREALKLTWIYYQNDNMGNGHEYPMYTFLGGEPLWSILAHREFLAKEHENTPIHAYVSLASLYAQYGEFEQAEKTLEVANAGLPEPPWRIMRQADLQLAFGDLYAAWGKLDQAKMCYGKAAKLYPAARPPYGGHLLPRRANEARSKLELLTLKTLELSTLRDGRYQDKALGYAGDINVTTFISSGRIADVKLRHEEKIDQNACVLIPQWIVEKQSLDVDGISGATVTRAAIINGTYRCLKKAGLK